MEFHAGRKGGWSLIGNQPSGKNEDNEAYLINDSAIDMIVETEQAKGVQIVFQQNEFYLFINYLWSIMRELC